MSEVDTTETRSAKSGHNNLLQFNFHRLSIPATINRMANVINRSKNTRLAVANTEFALDLYKELCGTKKGKIFISPFSISQLLTMVYMGAKGNTASEMKQALKLSDLKDEDINAGYKKMISLLKADKESNNYILHVANKVFAKKGGEFLKEYLDLTRDVYNAEAQDLDFAGDPEGSRNTINTWVEEQTAEKIRNIISGELDRETAMILVNAIYFKGDWMDKFRAKSTRPGQFRLGEGKEVEVPMMYREGEVNYTHDRGLRCQMIELPYINGDLSFYAILPESDDGLAELSTNITASKLTLLMKRMTGREVHIYLPKFKMEQELHLNPILEALGMVEGMQGSLADFSGIDGSGELYISQVVHKAFIELNEEGSEAAAATARVESVGSAISDLESKPITFKADHPFLFLIRDNRTEGILFLGHLTNPTY